MKFIMISALSALFTLSAQAQMGVQAISEIHTESNNYACVIAYETSEMLANGADGSLAARINNVKADGSERALGRLQGQMNYEGEVGPYAFITFHKNGYLSVRLSESATAKKELVSFAKSDIHLGGKVSLETTEASIELTSKEFSLTTICFKAN